MSFGDDWGRIGCNSGRLCNVVETTSPGNVFIPTDSNPSKIPAHTWQVLLIAPPDEMSWL